MSTLLILQVLYDIIKRDFNQRRISELSNIPVKIKDITHIHHLESVISIGYGRDKRFQKFRHSR